MWIRHHEDWFFGDLAVSSTPRLFGRRLSYSVFSPCHQATVPGSYTVDAKVLLWNAKGRDYEMEQSCTKARVGRMPRSIPAKYPLHAGFQAFKMVYPEQPCC
jgi:hypothetical protein